MSDLNPAEDDETTEVVFPRTRTKRRSSILKIRQPLSDLGSSDNDTEQVPIKKSRRVSFSNKPEVREIPKINYREPVFDREAESTSAQHSVDPPSALAVTGDSSRSDVMSSIQSLLLPPKRFKDQCGFYKLTNESDFKTLLNTNQNKVVAVCRASLMSNDTVEMTNCRGNTSARPPSAEEGLSRMELESDVSYEGRKADCTLAQSFNKTKVFGDVSMEMTRCYGGLEGSFVEESCFNQTMLAGGNNEDLELDSDDEGKPCVAVSGKYTTDDDRSARCRLSGDGVSGRSTIPASTSLIDVNSFISALEFGHCRSNNKAVGAGKMPFDIPKGDGNSFIPSMQSGKQGDGLQVTNCVSDVCKEFDSNRTVLLSDEMDLTDCMTKTMKLDATVLSPRETNTQNQIPFGADVNRTVSLGDDSRYENHEMSFTKCFGEIGYGQATFLSQKNADRTRIFTMEGNGEDIEQTECIEADVFQNATQTDSNWDLAETRVFSQSEIDALSEDNTLAARKTMQSPRLLEVTARPPLFDVNDLIFVLNCKGNSRTSRQFDETKPISERKKETFPDVEVSSGAMTNQVYVMNLRNLGAVVTEAEPFIELNSSSCATSSSFAQDLSLVVSGSLAPTTLMSGRDARLVDQVTPEVLIAPETSDPRIAIAAADPVLQHLYDHSLSDVTNLPWSANPRIPLSEPMEEEDMEIDMTVNLTQALNDFYRSKNRSADEQITSVLQEDKINSVVRIDRPENKDKSLITSCVGHCESKSLHSGMSSKPDDTLMFSTNEIKRSFSKSLSEQALVEMHKDQSRHVSLDQVDHLGNLVSTGEISSKAVDVWKLGIGLPVAATEGLVSEGDGKGLGCVDVSEEFLEKAPKRRRVSDADGKVGDTVGGGADSVEAALKAGNVTQEMASSLHMHVADLRDIPSEKSDQHLDADLTTPRLRRPSLPSSTTFQNTSILFGKELARSVKLKGSALRVSTNPAVITSASMLYDTSRHLNHLDATDVSCRGLLDMVSLDQSSLLNEPTTFAMESLVRNVPMLDSDDDDKCIERTQNRTDLRITSAFHLSRFELPTLDCSEMQVLPPKTIDLLPTVAPSVNGSDKEEPENVNCFPVVTDAEDIVERENGRAITSADVIEVELSQTNLGNANDVGPSQSDLGSVNSAEGQCLVLPKSPSQMEIDQQVVLPEAVREPQMSVGESVVMPEEPTKTSPSRDKGDLRSSTVTVDGLSESPENLERRLSSKNSEQAKPTALKHPGVAVEEVIVFANEELRQMDEEMKENLRVKGVLMESLIVSLTEARNQIPQIKPRDKFSKWDLEDWKSSGCSFTFLCETLVLDVHFGPEVTGAMFCGRPAREISTLTMASYPEKNMRPDCELAHRLINESFNGSVLRSYRDTSQLDKVLHHVLVWILKAETVRKDIEDLDPLHIGHRVEIEGHRVTVSYSSVKAHVGFTVECDVHLPQQLDTCPAWTIACDWGHIREEDVLEQIKQVKPGFHYLGDVYRRIQTWLDALEP